MDWIFPLFLLTMMQLIFGIDNALFISIEANKLPKEKRAFARNIGVIMAGAARIILLFVLYYAMKAMTEPFWGLHLDWIGGDLSFEVLVMVGGGIFLCFESVTEMIHLAKKAHLAHSDGENEKPATTRSVITQIVILNVIFSIDSILTAIALTDILWVMIVSISISVIVMIALADRLSAFLEKFELFTFTGLQILALIGVVLIGEGLHKGNFEIFGWHVVPLHSSWLFLLMFLFIFQDYCLFKKKDGKSVQIVVKD